MCYWYQSIDINKSFNWGLILDATSLNNRFVQIVQSCNSMQVPAYTRKSLETKDEQSEALEARKEALEQTTVDLVRPGFSMCNGVEW